jgi:hypothetical protein
MERKMQVGGRFSSVDQELMGMVRPRNQENASIMFK